MWVIRLAGAIHIIESSSLSEEIIWSVRLSWVHNSTLWWCACAAQWFSGTLSPRPDIRAVIEVLWGVLSLRWAGLNEGCFAQDRLTLRADCLRSQWSTTAFVCGHGGHGGAIVGTRGSQRDIERRPSIHLAQQLEEQEISTQEIMQSKQDSYDYFITFISLGLSSFCRKLVKCVYSPTKQSGFSLCWILQHSPAPSIHSDTNKLYFGGISSLSSPPFLCLISARALRRGFLNSSQTSWISALLSLSPLTHFPYCLHGLTPTWGLCTPGTWKAFGLRIRFTVNGPLMCSREDADMRRRWKRFIFSSGFHSDGLSESLSGFIAWRVWSGIDFWYAAQQYRK